MTKEQRNAIVDIIKPIEFDVDNGKVINIISDAVDYYKYGFRNEDEDASHDTLLNIGYWQGKYYASISIIRELFNIEVFCSHDDDDNIKLHINVITSYEI